MEREIIGNGYLSIFDITQRGWVYAQLCSDRAEWYWPGRRIELSEFNTAGVGSIVVSCCEYGLVDLINSTE
jgi:hypothetical protein